MPMSEAARREAIDKAMQAYAESPGQEAISLPYKDGTQGPFSVISVPLESVVLNPRSHRIKSQLESDPEREVVARDPFSEEAQAVIHKILAATDRFADLKANLAEYGQRDPGVITRAGLMVNANTRVVALTELDPNGFIRAAVLPSDADSKAIDRLELELQVQRNFKQEYTFTNELLFVNELLEEHNYTVEDAAKALNWAASGDEKELKRGKAQIEQSVRLYALVRSIQAISGGKVPLTFFDDKKQILTDLDDRYEATKESAPAGAERMKEARILGLLLECDYRDLRKITGDSSIELLLPSLEERDDLAEDLEALTTPGDGADEDGETEGDDSELLAGGEDEADERTFQPLAKLVATSYGEETVELPSGTTIGRGKASEEIVEAFEDAAEDQRQSEKASKTVGGPVKALSDALKKARLASAGYKDAKGDDEFDHGKFGYLTKKLRAELDAIQKSIEQHEAS